MYAAPPLLSFLLILLYYSGWTYGLCQMENITAAWCHSLQDVKYVDGHLLESLKAPATQDALKPGLFDGLSNLRHLDMSGGSLKKIEPGNFRALSNLRSLNLGDNPLEYLELASLEGLTHLRSLNLRKNAIRQLPPALARLKNLRHLDIHGNPLECNCATLKVRDLIAQRGVIMSKKVMCVGPGGTKGTSLMKPNAAIICNLEQQDREMQNDQPVGSGMDPDSSDVLDELSEEDVEDEYVEVHNVSSSSEKPREPEVETPFSAVSLDPTTEYSATKSTAASTESTVAPKETTGTTTSSLQSTAEDEEIFFDSEEKKERSTTTEMSRQKENIKDSLYYPTGSGDGDEASGEGSGTGWTHYDEERTSKDDSPISENPTLFGILWDTLFGTTAMPMQTKDPELEEEQFMVAPSEEPRNIHPVESDVSETTVETKITTARSISGVEVIKPVDASNESKSGNVKVEVDELTEESSSKQSKKGMGSYVVLAALLAVLVALIGCAAYKGNCCKKKKREDVETGTELKDVQKSLIPDDENTTQPKIASNGNAENASLVESTSENDRRHIIYNGDMFPPDPSTYLRPIKPHHSDSEKAPENDENGENGQEVSPIDDRKVEERPRVDVNALKENFFAKETSFVQVSPAVVNNGPVSEPNESPVSPGAHKVKITLQVIPDSVPKTPILITRTMADENLVKTP